MKYPVDISCEECGEKARYDFVTEGAQQEYLQLWYEWHQGNGHKRSYFPFPRPRRKVAPDPATNPLLCDKPELEWKR